MRLVSFLNESNQVRSGVVSEHGVIDLHGTDPIVPACMNQLLAGGDRVLSRVRQLLEHPHPVVIQQPRLLAPVPRPSKVICIGLNYRDHAKESGSPIPVEPIVFSKFPSAICGTGAEIELPASSQQVDYEAELVVVIGRRAKHVKREDAGGVVAGYTCGHDVSARDWQLTRNGKQWLVGKTFDTFAPIGPYLVTADDVPDPHQLPIRLRLNGQIMQESNTSQMIFRVDELIAWLTQIVTLEPGDVLFTGTGPGVGFARKPPVFLQPGDVCEVEIEGVGLLHNRCTRATT